MVVNNINIKDEDKINIYLDASVLISFLEGQNDNISDLFEFCNHNKKCKLISSPFTTMEALDIKQEHTFFSKKVAIGVPLKHILAQRRDRDLSKEELKEIHDRISRKLKSNGLGWFFYPQDYQWWILALDIVRDCNINSSDAIHLAQAIYMGCNYLVTTDTSFIKEAKYYLENCLKIKLIKDINVCLPEKALEKIRGDLK